MTALMLATEAVVDHPGDDWTVVAYVLVGIALLVAAVATVMVTPHLEHHDH